ncbi:MAG: SDR family NAD(P)-dependent oxidoreductase [Deltaproteobacteria bacterium]|nr:SDR family NAD(P)-dependent oxidoreductase [Deltaproteobacteria bacterium]
MKIVVTGASRGAGRAMAERLAELGHQVRAMVRKPADVARLAQEWSGRPGLEPVRGDVTEPGSLVDVFAGMDGFVHAAAFVGDDPTGRESYRVNVEGTGHVVRAAAHGGARAGVCISSVAVYGRPDVPEVAETAPFARHEVPYERTKAAAETVALELGRLFGVRLAVLRPSVLWGAYDEQFVPRVLAALRRHAFTFVGDPRRPMNVCATEHLLQCALAALRTDAAAGEAFNVVDGALPCYRDAIALIAGEAGLPVPTRKISKPLAVGLGTALDALRSAGVPGIPPGLTRFTARVMATGCVYRTDKARRVLGYQPTLSFLEHGAPSIRDAISRGAGTVT